MKKDRIDNLLVERGLAVDINEARRFIMAGLAIADDKRIDKAGDKVEVTADVRLKKRTEFASRGGYKLQKAVQLFKLDMTDATVMDIGSSTGGFTDISLRAGAKLVYAIDVGYNLLLDRLRRDERVKLFESTNFRTIDFDIIGEQVDYIVTDVSFISLTQIIPSTIQFMRNGSKFVALIKPQFEAERGEIEEGGIVHDKSVHLRVSLDIAEFAAEYGYKLNGFTTSPITGAKGNVEYLAYFMYTDEKFEQDYNLIRGEFDD